MRNITKEELKRLVLVSIISADNDEFDEDTKQAILERLNKQHKEGRDDLDRDWDYVLEPISNVENRNKLINFFKAE